MAFYTSIFKDSKILRNVDLPDPELSRIEFELAGQPIVALNAHAHAPYNEAFSLLVETEDQEETDYYWAALTADGGKNSHAAG